MSHFDFYELIITLCLCAIGFLVTHIRFVNYKFKRDTEENMRLKVSFDAVASQLKIAQSNRQTATNEFNRKVSVGQNDKKAVDTQSNRKVNTLRVESLAKKNKTSSSIVLPDSVLNAVRDPERGVS